MAIQETKSENKMIDALRKEVQMIFPEEIHSKAPDQIPNRKALCCVGFVGKRQAVTILWVLDRVNFYQGAEKIHGVTKHFRPRTVAHLNSAGQNVSLSEKALCSDTDHFVPCSLPQKTWSAKEHRGLLGSLLLYQAVLSSVWD